jgi:hypothetical protein
LSLSFVFGPFFLSCPLFLPLWLVTCQFFLSFFSACLLSSFPPFSLVSCFLILPSLLLFC